MSPTEPLVVEALRGGQVESLHAVDAMVASADGSIAAVYGDGERGVFPRSAIKALQVSARSGEGMGGWIAWIEAARAMALAGHPLSANAAE